MRREEDNIKDYWIKFCFLMYKRLRNTSQEESFIYLAGNTYKLRQPDLMRIIGWYVKNIQFLCLYVYRNNH